MDRDASLVIQLRMGDERALSSLISRYRQPLQYFIYCKVNNIEDAEDLFMETIEEAYAKINKYNPTHKFSTWLYTIGRNKTIDFLRYKNRIPNSAPLLPILELQEPSPEQMLINKQYMAILNNGMNKLKEKNRRIIEMRLDGDRFEVIAKSLKLSPIASRTRYHRSIKYLNELLSPPKR